MGCGSSAPYEPSEAELEAERHEENIAKCVQRYTNLLEPLRAEITKAKSLYHVELADETNRRLGMLQVPRMSTKQADGTRMTDAFAFKSLARRRHAGRLIRDSKVWRSWRGDTHS